MLTMFSTIRQFSNGAISSRLLGDKFIPANKKPLGDIRIVLSGEIFKKPEILPSGDTVFLLSTRDENHGSIIHRIRAKFTVNIPAGRHAYVTGLLNTTEFKNQSDKTRFEGTVTATELLFIKPCYQDINSVEAKGLAYNTLVDTDDFSMFRMLNSHWCKAQNRIVFQYIPVIVYDRRLRELAKEALQMSSLVRVVGQLGRSRELNKEALMRTALHIRATNIFVSERRNQIAADYDGTNNERDSSPSRDHERKTAQKSAKAKSSRRVNRTIKDMMRQDYIV